MFHTLCGLFLVFSIEHIQISCSAILQRKFFTCFGGIDSIRLYCSNSRHIFAFWTTLVKSTQSKKWWELKCIYGICLSPGNFDICFCVSPKICLAQTSFAFLDLVGHAESLRFAQRLLLPFLTCQNWCAPKTLNFFSAREQSYTYGWVRKYVDFWCSLQTVYQTSAVSCLTQRPNDLCWFGDKPTRCGCAICWSSSCEFLPKICRVLCNKDGITCRNNTKFHLCAGDRACGVFLTSGAAILRNGIAFPPISVLVKLTNSMFSSGLPPKIGFTSGFEGWGWVKKIDCKYWQSFCCKTLRFCCGCSLRFGTGLVILVPGLSKSPMSMERICRNTSPD